MFALFLAAHICCIGIEMNANVMAWLLMASAQVVKNMASAYQSTMANPATAPILFDRALLRARQRRALRDGPATFLLDRVVEDMAERVQAVLREFKDGADVGTAGDQVRNRTGRSG